MSKHGILYKEKFYNGQAFILTGDRRMAVAIPKGKHRDYYFCSESLPDAAAAAGASSTININTTKPNGSKSGGAMSDTFGQALLKTFTRTENAELFRNWNYAYCLFASQGWLTDEQSTSAKLFGEMTAGVIDAMKKNAEKGVAPPDGGETVTVKLEVVQPAQENND